MEGLKVGRVWSQKFNNIQVKRDIICFPLRSLAKWQNPFVCSLCWNNRTYGFWPLIANSHEISQCISLADQGKYIIIIYFGVSRWLMVNVGESDGVICIAGVSKERAEIALKMEALFSFETLARDPNSTGCQRRKTCLCDNRWNSFWSILRRCQPPRGVASAVRWLVNDESGRVWKRTVVA